MQLSWLSDRGNYLEKLSDRLLLLKHTFAIENLYFIFLKKLHFSTTGNLEMELMSLQWLKASIIQSMG